MNNVMDFMQACTVSEMTVQVPKEIVSRPIYAKAKAMLENAGGRWNAKKWGFDFKEDPAPLLQRLLLGDTVNVRKETQFFPTPPALADRMALLLSLKPGESVLEPSAGEGALIDAVLKLDVPQTTIFYVEKSITHIRTLYEKYRDVPDVGYMNPLNDDFLNLSDGVTFERIIANPPFANNQDITHIVRMYKALKRGGRMVTLCSGHPWISNNKIETSFVSWLTDKAAGIDTVPAGTFADTNVATRLIILDK